MARIAALPKKRGTLDYVTAWFLKAGAYIQNTHAKIGFVATNSITQGEQVAELWPLLFDRYNLDIAFAHRTFAWGSEARGKAHVHVVIIGLDLRGQTLRNKRLFDYPDLNGAPIESSVSAISPYLFDAGNLADPHTVVYETNSPPAGMPPMIIGSKPIDDGNYIFTDEERETFLADEPAAVRFLHPYIGSVEFINGDRRWILALQNATPAQIRAMPHVRRRIEAVQTYRASSKSAPTRKLAAVPTLYHVNVIPTSPFLVIPEASSEQRQYVPIGYLEPPVIPSNLVRIIENASPTLFGLLTSRMHMAWLRYIGGRLKSDYRYSIGIVYNPFPWPVRSPEDDARIGTLSQAVLAARQNYPESSLADLYDAASMPPELRGAHQELDRAVDRLYRRDPFASDRERVEFLLARYEHERAPLVVSAHTAKKRRRKR